MLFLLSEIPLPLIPRKGCIYHDGTDNSNHNIPAAQLSLSDSQDTVLPIKQIKLSVFMHIQQEGDIGELSFEDLRLIFTTDSTIISL